MALNLWPLPDLGLPSPYLNEPKHGDEQSVGTPRTKSTQSRITMDLRGTANAYHPSILSFDHGNIPCLATHPSKL
jgi:hypothetical protein